MAMTPDWRSKVINSDKTELYFWGLTHAGRSKFIHNSQQTKHWSHMVTWGASKMIRSINEVYFSSLKCVFICICKIIQPALRHTQGDEIEACSWINNFNFFSFHYLLFSPWSELLLFLFGPFQVVSPNPYQPPPISPNDFKNSLSSDSPINRYMKMWWIAASVQLSA